MKRLLRLLTFNKQDKRYRFIENVIQTERISVLQAVKFIFSFWKPVLICAGVFGVIGLIGAFKSQQEMFTSESVVIPDGGAPPKQQESSELADFLEQQIPSSSQLGVESFPGIIENYPFLINLLDEEVLSERNGGYVSLGNYVSTVYTPSKLSLTIAKLKSLPDRFWELFESDDTSESIEGPILNMPTDTLNQVTEKQIGRMQLLSQLIRVEGNSTITIQTDAPEPKVSTRLNNLIIEKLVEEVTRIKTAKQQRNLGLIMLQLDTAKQNFEIRQMKLADFRDANKGNNSASVQTELQKLESEYSLYFSIYSSLATEYELAKIELIENTPFYDIIEPAYIPLLPSNSQGFSFSSVIRNSAIGIVIGIVGVVIYCAMLIFVLIRQKLKETEL